jgi:hypothetical protein
MTDKIVVVQSSTPSIVVEENNAQLLNVTGMVGPKGDKGDKGDDGTPGGSYTHNQSALSAVWTINHNLNFNPNVIAQDSSGGTIEGNVDFTSINSLTITFSVASSGTAYLS